jgi:SAM-dependent methyltransferase
MRALPFDEIKKQIATLEVAERFFDSVVLFTLFDLGVFSFLDSGPRAFEDIAAQVGGDEETLRATLDAGVALRLLERDGEKYGADEYTLDCLGRPDSPSYMGEWIAFLHSLAGPLFNLNEAVLTGATPGALFEDMSDDNLPARRMTQAMDAYARSRGIELSYQYDFTGVESLLDFGAGPGTYSLAIVEQYPEVAATLVDLDGPIAEARRIAARRGMEDRVEFIVADGRTWDPGRQWDLVLISNTLHMIGESGSRQLLGRAYEWVAPGGRLIVQAQYLNDDRTSPRWPTLLNLIQRVATPDGRNHALGETTAWLEEAGFESVEHVRLSLWNVNSLLVAHRA